MPLVILCCATKGIGRRAPWSASSTMRSYDRVTLSLQQANLLLKLHDALAQLLDALRTVGRTLFEIGDRAQETECTFPLLFDQNHLKIQILPFERSKVRDFEVGQVTSAAAMAQIPRL